MVKNKNGGNKAKKQGRKFTQVDPANVQTRYSQDPDEIYACCKKLLGNGMCYVVCTDGKERLCIIRRKFSGRGKRDNILVMGTWCLVGRRSFETKNDSKMEKCDLLEVYGEIDKKKIMQKEVRFKDCWKHFTSCSQEFDEDVSFGEAPILEMPNSDNEDDENENIEKNENSKFSINDDEDIDVNDI